MPRMQRYIVALLLIMIVSGCALKQQSTIPNHQIDSLLVEALLLESQGLYINANAIYEKAYKITHDPILLQKIINNYYRAKNYEKAIATAKQALKEFPKNRIFYEQLAAIYFATSDYDRAIDYIKKAISIKKTSQNLTFLGSILLAKKEYEAALKYYKGAYALDPSPKTINTIAYILFFYLDKKTEAIAYLETHTRLYGCSKEVCGTLISFYSLNNNIDGLISVYKRLYQKYNDIAYAKKIAELYIYNKEFSKAIEWAKKINDTELLFSLYKTTKKFKKAYELAMQFYNQTKDPKYLAQAAIFEYEAHPKKDRKLLEDVAQKLEKAIKKNRDPIFLNYLGYLYIDHELNIKRGIALVKEALQADPLSPYYLDSLAWGYYKIGKCKEALKLIKKVYYDLQFKDDEIKLHLEKIKKCVKEKH